MPYDLAWYTYICMQIRSQLVSLRLFPRPVVDKLKILEIPQTDVHTGKGACGYAYLRTPGFTYKHRGIWVFRHV